MLSLDSFEIILELCCGTMDADNLRRPCLLPVAIDKNHYLCFHNPLLHHSIGLHAAPHFCHMTSPEALDALRSTRARIAKPAIRPKVMAGRVRTGRSVVALKHVARSSPSHDDERPAGLTAREEPAPTLGQEGHDVSTVHGDDSALRDWINYAGRKHPLRVVFVGHNPSDRSWDVCAPYAHSSNRFWKLLGESGLVEEGLSRATMFAKLPDLMGLGFVDLFVTRGSDAKVVEQNARKDTGWRDRFIQRVRDGTHGRPPRILACVSKTVAQQLLPKWKGDFGPAGFGREWNLPGLEQVQIWVLPSTSARAVLSHENRLAPFVALKRHLDLEPPWNPSSHET